MVSTHVSVTNMYCNEFKPLHTKWIVAYVGHDVLRGHRESGWPG